MVKVLMCGNHPSNKGGMTSVISQIMSHDWKKDNIQLKFIPTFYPGNNVIKAMYFAVAYIKVLFALLFFRPDIVHMHMSYKGSFQRKYLIFKLCKRFKIKVIIHLHGSEFEKWFNSANYKTKKKVRYLLRESNAFLVLGEKWKSVINTIEPLANTIVVRNAIAIPDTMVQWNDAYCQILYLGVLIERKGLDDLLYALDILKVNNKLDGIKVAIAGSGSEEIRLKKICKQKKLEKYVTFYGWISGKEKERLIKDSQVMVLPSYNEGLPVSILEAISYGMPVVATDVGDVSAAVHNEQNGFIVSPGDIDALAQKLGEVSQKGYFIRMSRESRKIAQELFSEDVFFSILRECYFGL